MGTFLEVADYDRDVENLRQPPLIINDMPEFTKNDRNLITNAIFRKFSTDLLSNVPSCDCEHLSREYNYGVICPKCQTPVRDKLDEELETRTWIRAPKDVTALVNPLVWEMLSRRFTWAGVNYIQYYADHYYRLQKHQLLKHEPILRGLQVPRGLNSFIKNFDVIIDYLFKLQPFRMVRGKGKIGRDFLRDFITQNRHKIFPKYIPIPHRSLLVVEDSRDGGASVYMDDFTPRAIDAARCMAGIDTATRSGEISTNVHLRETRAVRCISTYAEFHYEICTKRMARKEGFFRKQVYATRGHHTFRAVVSSNTDPHHYRQIQIPWGVGVSLFALHLENKLFRLGFTPNEAVEFLNTYALKYHPLLDHLFRELIGESGHPLGISATINRNPSLKRGSIQSVYIDTVKRPELDNTVTISILIIRRMNCDFDGDALQFSLTLDKKIEYAVQTLAPHMSVFSLDRPRKLDDTQEIPKPVVATIANWMEYPISKETPEPDIIKRMEMLYD